MKILTSNINMSSYNEHIYQYNKSEVVNYWDNRETKNEPNNNSDTFNTKQKNDSFEKSSDLEKLSKDELKKFERFIGNIKLRLFRDFLEKLTGKKIEIEELNNLDLENNQKISTPQSEGPKTESPQLEGWGFSYEMHEVKYEKQDMKFSATGNITTEDGRELNFNTSLQMSREKYSEITVSMKAGDALIDPLVLNFDGAGAQLSDKTMNFDLNADGKTEKINILENGSGFLVLDRNNNGKIDNGSELFGPKTNSGFAELSELDSNNDGWIDENDPLFYQLKIWEKSDNQTENMSTLLEKNVGAISLQKSDTNFGLYGNNGKMNGQIRETGIFLKEDGGTGYIHELDVVA